MYYTILSAQSDQSSLSTWRNYPKCALWRYWPDCVNAQANLNLHWAHMSKSMLWLICFTIFTLSILGPVVQNLTKLLVNVNLKFLSWNMANTLIFFAEKMWVVCKSYSHLSSKNISKNINVFENTLATTVTP